MSVGLGVYAAIPGGGSLESRDSSRIILALVAGFIIVTVVGKDFGGYEMMC
jgi:hypothetical protein